MPDTVAQQVNSRNAKKILVPMRYDVNQYSTDFFRIIEQLTHSSKKIGELETKLLQIEAPKELSETVEKEKKSFRFVPVEQTQHLYSPNSVREINSNVNNSEQ